MNNHFKQGLDLCLGLVVLCLLAVSIAGCSLIEKFTDPLAVEKNSLIIIPGSGLYKSLEDSESYETLEDEALVRKTGRCRESKAMPGEILCPIKGVYSDIEAWVLEYTLVEFMDYLP